MKKIRCEASEIKDFNGIRKENIKLSLKYGQI